MSPKLNTNQKIKGKYIQIFNKLLSTKTTFVGNLLKIPCVTHCELNGL